MVLKNKELRSILAGLPRFPGTRKVKNYSVVNEGFPGKFNLSFTEAEMLDEFDSYVDITNPLIYSKTQPCIRNVDFEQISTDKGDVTHLGLFDLADIHGQAILPTSEKKGDVLRFCIQQIWNFLTEKMGFKPSQIYVSSFKGGWVKQTTGGKYDFKKKIPAEKLALEIWKDVGLPNNNNNHYTNRETFLSLHLQRPTPWGYRNEIFVKIKGKLIDVATLEYLIFKPVFKNGKIVDFVEGDILLAVSGVGIERMLMAKNGYGSIVECDHIYPLRQKILQLAKKKDKHRAFVLCEALRVCHRVFTDCGGYSELSRTRKELIRKYLRALREGLVFLRVDVSAVKKLLALNSKLQDYYPELKKSEGRTYKDIETYVQTLDDLEQRGKLK